MSADQPTVSVALCTFNGADFVGAQLESILAQSRPPEEIVVSDDASTDNTLDIVSRQLQAASVRVQVFANSSTLGFARNFEQAVNACTGSIIFLCDQDDVWLENKVAAMLHPFDSDPDVGLVFCDAYLADSNMRVSPNTLFSRRRAAALNSARGPEQLVRGVEINGCTMAFTGGVRDCSLPMHASWGHDHWLAFVAHATSEVKSIDTPLMNYRRHVGSAGNDPQLEGGRTAVWKKGIELSTIDDYRVDRRRWEAMTNHLRALAGRAGFRPVSRDRFDQYVCACARRLEFARFRERSKAAPRLQRLPGVVGQLAQGHYHRYLHGFRSVTKDLLIR